MQSLPARLSTLLLGSVLASAPAWPQVDIAKLVPATGNPLDMAAMLVTTGLWDRQVQYYEPAKWVAKLRRANRSNQPLLLHVNLEAGHGGKSGRYERLREVAREYGFIIDLGGAL